MSTLAHDPYRAQRMSALTAANHVRIGRSQLRRDLHDGRITLAAALQDPRADTMPVGDLLRGQRRWGPTRVRVLLSRLMISETKRVGSLTDRQRGLIVEAACEVGVSFTGRRAA